MPRTSKPITPTNPFSIPALAGVAIPVSSLTPKMNRVRSVVCTTTVATFTVALDFFYSQSYFDIIFDLNPTILRLSQKGKIGYVDFPFRSNYFPLCSTYFSLPNKVSFPSVQIF